MPTLLRNANDRVARRFKEWENHSNDELECERQRGQRSTANLHLPKQKML